MLAKSTEANGWNEPGMDAYDNYDTGLLHNSAIRCERLHTIRT